MLVKFLSYVASIIGARRYKPIFISLAVLTLTVTGITMVASALSNGSHDTASFEQSKTDPEEANQPSPSDLKGLNRQEAKDESGQSIPKAEATTSADTSKAAQAPDKQPASPVAPELTLPVGNLTMQGSSSHTITATTTSSSTPLTWSVNGDSVPNGLTVTIDQKDQANTTIRLKTENVTPGNYQLTVTLKDGATGLSTQKILQLTVAQQP